MKLRNLLVLGSMAVMGAAFTSCSKDVAFDSEGLANQAAEQLKAEYRANFEKKFGAIAPNQTWDFSTMKSVSGLPSKVSAARTRGEVSVNQIGTAGEMIIEKEAISWMKTNMKPGNNNAKQGIPFYMKTQEQTFTIVPCYQGQAGYYWELWMNVGGQDVYVWSKNTALKYRTSAKGAWKDLTGQVPSNAVEVKAPTYTYKATAEQHLYFYLKVWTGGSRTSDNPDKITSSLDKLMLGLEGAKQYMSLNVPEGNDVTLVGCEDNPTTGTDNDFEDLVFMVYGKPTPPIIPVDEIEITQTKRYLMEDLGAIDDFDFNDVVVDVQNVKTQKIYLKPAANGGWEEDRRDPEVDAGQRAIVRAAGGIYNFTLKIGDTEWVKGDKVNASQMINTGWGNTTIDPDYEIDRFTVTGWNPNTNNISLYVPQKSGTNYTDVMQVIQFPKAGDAPMIIAVDEAQGWMKERQSIPGGTNSPDDWWYNPVNQ
jgi:hypothetical protein